MITAEDLTEKFFTQRFVAPDNRERVKLFIHSLSDETIASVWAMADESIFGYNVGVLVEDFCNVELLQEYLRFAPVISPKRDDGLGDVTRELVSSLHHYESLAPHHDYSKADSTVQRQCEALLRVAHAYRRRTKRNFDLRDSYNAELHFPLGAESSIREKALVEHLLENPEDDALIADFIWERSLMKWGDIKEFLAASSNATSLTSGIL